MIGCLDAEAEDFVCDYHLEMLSLSQDQQNPASIQFDDLSWQCHLPSLKPLGLNIMLNLCNASITQQLCRFSDHLSNLALQESHGTVLPVYVPWGLCELSRLIGEGCTVVKWWLWGCFFLAAWSIFMPWPSLPIQLGFFLLSHENTMIEQVML